jgi:hypothetical protein
MKRKEKTQTSHHADAAQQAQPLHCTEALTNDESFSFMFLRPRNKQRSPLGHG